ncbi:MAG: sensor histidine kinase, partial [Clostridia bacterium]|nr:sensor histidine kinase [Clostridia bacterium]
MNLRQVLFYCCVAHTLQHMIHCLSRLGEMALTQTPFLTQGLQALYLVLTLLLIFRVLRERFRGSETVDIQNATLVVFALISTLIVYFLSFWASEVEQETVGMLLFDFFTCLLIMFILLDIFRLRRARREQEIMQRLLREEQAQHALSRATIDVVNRKCHDLRHQIAALRHMDRDDREKSIAELEEAVLIYDSFPKTGNSDVDIVLAEKSLLAEQQQIMIRAMVDGNGFRFMKLEDIYCLLANALDNAIEATSKEPQKERRIITFHAAQRENMFSVHLENPCAKEPVFMDGIPMTDKPDTDYHGYGMRSMRYLCEKYGGVLTTGWEDGIYALDMLFPLK